MCKRSGIAVPLLQGVGGIAALENLTDLLGGAYFVVNFLPM